MRKISEFATLCGTSPKTLRFYEKVGLLKASYTNPENGYRYYRDEQEREYALITVFKELGFTLEEIKKNIVSGDTKRSITLQRYDTEQKLVVSDGTVIKTFTCPFDRMDLCAEVIQDLFCVPGHGKLSLADVPAITEDRAILVLGVEGTMEEILSTDHATRFDQSAHFADISTVLLSIKITCGASIEEIDRITSKFIHLFSTNCTVLWGASLDSGYDHQVKVSMIGVY